jgi:L-lactate utilization protein LutC
VSEGEDREAFLQRVRQALGRERGAPPAPPELDESMARLASAEEDLPSLFAQQAEEVGLEVQRCAASQWPQAMTDWLEALGARHVVYAPGALDETGEGERRLRERGVTRLSWEGDARMASAFEAEVGITAAAGLAETGTLVVRADAMQGRGLSLAPPVHLALLREADVLPDLVDWCRRMERGPAASSEALITGPSKTADIEGELVKGVHGPGRVIVLLIR